MFAGLLPAQTIQLFSEFQRVDPFGEILPQDRSPRPREIISPAAPRNGFVSFHVAVTGPPNTNYFLFVQTNPPGIFRTALYKEQFTEHNGQWIPDHLDASPTSCAETPCFGVIPDAQIQIPGQTTRLYLLDVWVPPNAEINRRVRLEVAIKVGSWIIYPLEIRIIEALVPQREQVESRMPPAEVQRTASEFTQAPLAAYLAGAPLPPLPKNVHTVREVMERNAAQDMALARLANTPEVWLLIARQIANDWTRDFPFPILPGAEWYLRVRDLIYRRASFGYSAA